MTYKEAAEILKKKLKANRAKYTGEHIDAMLCAIRTLERTAEKIPARHVTDLTGKCGACLWFRGPKTKVGVVCECPDKKWKDPVARMKARTTKACRFFVEGTNQYQENAIVRRSDNR